MEKTGESYTTARINTLGKRSTSRARDLVDKALSIYPKLKRHGLNTYSDDPAKDSDLYSDEFLDEVETCARWLEKQTKIKTVNRKHTSYGYKHSVERWVDSYSDVHQYISNGAVIAAAVGLGFDVVRQNPGSPNAAINISEKGFREFESTYNKNVLVI